tara:strand:- start:3111 stop:3389 length:279 start_codon:yes stop_codon:yes gene_type:complete
MKKQDYSVAEIYLHGDAVTRKFILPYKLTEHTILDVELQYTYSGGRPRKLLVTGEAIVSHLVETDQYEIKLQTPIMPGEVLVIKKFISTVSS